MPVTDKFFFFNWPFQNFDLDSEENNMKVKYWTIWTIVYPTLFCMQRKVETIKRNIDKWIKSMKLKWNQPSSRVIYFITTMETRQSK